MATIPQPSQYAFRSLKQLGLVTGSPLFQALDTFERPEGGGVRAYAYSDDGRVFAFASPSSVRVVDATTGQLICEIAVKAVVEIALSPKGVQVSTWERMVKSEEGSQHLNMRVWDVATGEQIVGFSVRNQDGWKLQYTADESHALRQVTNEVHVYKAADFAAGVQDRLKLEGITSFSVSLSRNPCIATFVGEKKGAPASVKIFSLSTLSSASSQKTFFKADKIQMKWNSNGTSLLCLTQTDVDKTGKSYYGETNLYLLSAAGNFDCRVTLDKEGPIQDFAWSPNDKEFVVSYGFMPARLTLYDHRANVVHDFGPMMRNFVSFNPQGRLLCVAGFGNLQGTVDVWDRKTLKKASTFEAPNTSHCEWSPDGRFLLCATLSPRLRVDNGIRIYHHSGALLHVETMNELYQASWRPAPSSLFPFRDSLSPAPAPSPSAAAATPIKVAPKAAGPYRPPGARGTATPLAFKREDEGGSAYIHSSLSNGTNGIATPPASTGPPGSAQRARRVPGAAIPTDEPATPAKGKKGKKPANGVESAPAPGTPAPAPATNGMVEAPLSPEDKKRRALKKKLDAIEGLKERKARGDALEQTQLGKIATEAAVRKELESLG